MIPCLVSAPSTSLVKFIGLFVWLVGWMMHIMSCMFHLLNGLTLGINNPKVLWVKVSKGVHVLQAAPAAVFLNCYVRYIWMWIPACIDMHISRAAGMHG